MNRRPSWTLLAALAILANSNQVTADDRHLSLLLRIQPEAINAQGDLPERLGNEGWSIADGWGNGQPNGHNWGAVFVDAHHRFGAHWRLFARYGANIDMEGLKAGAARDREIEIGLDTPIGEFRAGRLETPYKLAGLGWDPLNATFLQGRANGGRSGGAFGHGGYVDNALGYRQQFGSVSLHAFAAVDQFSSLGSRLSNEKLAWAMALSAPLGPVEVVFAHIDASRFDGAADNRDASKVAVRWSDGPWTLTGQYEFRGAGLEDGGFFFLSGSYRVENWQFSLNSGRFSDDSGADNDGRYTALGARYSVSPSVSFHGGVRRLSRPVTGNENLFGVGARLSFSTGNLFSN